MIGPSPGPKVMSTISKLIDYVVCSYPNTHTQPKTSPRKKGISVQETPDAVMSIISAAMRKTQPARAGPGRL